MKNEQKPTQAPTQAPTEVPTQAPTPTPTPTPEELLQIAIDAAVNYVIENSLTIDSLITGEYLRNRQGSISVFTKGGVPSLLTSKGKKKSCKFIVDIYEDDVDDAADLGITEDLYNLAKNKLAKSKDFGESVISQNNSSEELFDELKNLFINLAGTSKKDAAHLRFILSNNKIRILSSGSDSDAKDKARIELNL